MALGGVDFDQLTTASSEASSARLQSALVFKEVPRLAKCLVEIALDRKDAGSVKAVLDCLRSVSAKAWYDGPWVLRQLPKVGDKAVSQSQIPLLVPAAHPFDAGNTLGLQRNRFFARPAHGGTSYYRNSALAAKLLNFGRNLLRQVNRH